MHPLKNEIKIRRLKFQVEELQNFVKECPDALDNTKALYIKAIDCRMLAIDFLRQARKHMPWPEIQKKFNINPYYVSQKGKNLKSGKQKCLNSS